MATSTYTAPAAGAASQPAVPRQRRSRKTARVEEPRPSGQVRVAEHFAQAYEGALIHVDRIGWHQWIDQHWRRMPDKRALASAHLLLRQLLREAVELSASERDQWLSDIRKCESATGLEGVVKLAAGMGGISVAAEDVDDRPDLLAFPNGTYQLSDDTFRPGRPDDYLTKVMGAPYDPDATCPNFDRMFGESQPDPQMRAYVLRMVGSSCEGRVREHMMPVMTGTGGNGKGSTLNDSFFPAFGDYAQALAVEVLLSTSGKDYMTERLALKGARYVLTSEPKAGARFNAALLKLLAGGDRISVRPLRENYTISWDPTHQLFMMANHRPHPPADDGGVWRRLKPVDWPNEVAPERMDTRLPQKLRGELPGICNRILEGWRDFRDNGLAVPESAAQALKAWRADVDLIGQFLEDRCVVDPEAKVKSSQLFTRWASWCHDMSLNPGTPMDFAPAVERKGFPRKRSDGMWFMGLGLRDLSAEGYR